MSAVQITEPGIEYVQSLHIINGSRQLMQIALFANNLLTYNCYIDHLDLVYQNAIVIIINMSYLMYFHLIHIL